MGAVKVGRPKAGVTFWDRLLAQTQFSGTGCFEFMGCRNSDGYGCLNRDGRLVRPHREAWREANGEIPDGIEVCHSCDNPPCWNPAHLFLGTHADNMADMKRKGRQKFRSGENHPEAKLDWVTVRLIRSERLGLIKTAQKYGVSKSLISVVRRGEVWKERNL